MAHHLYLDVLDRPAMLVSGWPVLAGLDELDSAVPAAWARVREALPRPPEGYATASVELEDGRYHLVVGVLIGPDDHAPGPVTVRIPAGAFLHVRHEGPLEEIADVFATLIAHAAASGYRVGAYRLDVGYTFTVREAQGPHGPHEAHDLWLHVLGHPAGDVSAG